MQVETASMLRCCQRAYVIGDDDLRSSARSVQSYMMHRIMDPLIDLPQELESPARRVIQAAMEADDG